ncbi:hypothetical protein [Pontibacter pudoricolor]|uniref:hypothetical protein n=1 Tax=Pontibacter pudoricolor TaxID=2694930 RepID=UPI0013908767|nr:hypothetical protein [Pontibacter pudoricolor]
MTRSVLRSLLLLVFSVLFFTACDDKEVAEPEVEFRTSEAFQIGPSYASVSVDLNLDKAVAVEEKGICWNTFGGPRIDNEVHKAGSGTGSFSAQLTGLLANTEYFVRGYYISNGQVTYGNEVSFRTPESPFKGEWANDKGTLKFTATGQGLVFKVANTPDWSEAVAEGYVTLNSTFFLRNLVPAGKKYRAEALWNYGTAADAVTGVQYSTNSTVTFNTSGSEILIETYSPINNAYKAITLYRQ